MDPSRIHLGAGPRHADGETLSVTDIMGRTLLHYAATLGRLAALSLGR
jgi:hypothetical protein